jgi:hypothetical protein
MMVQVLRCDRDVTLRALLVMAILCYCRVAKVVATLSSQPKQEVKWREGGGSELCKNCFIV